MTKHILHGGATRKLLEGNKKFFHEILSGLPKKVKVLVIYFAREEKDFTEIFEDDQNNFRSASPDKDIQIEIASYDPSVFREQLKYADAIYVRGGDTRKLMERIKDTPDFAELIEGKVYAGSSAGMYLVSKYYYSNDRDRIEEGLGILPIKSFAHWEEGKQTILQKLKETGEDLPIYKLAEGEYLVLEQ